MQPLIRADQVTPIVLDFMDDEHLHEIDLINRLYELLAGVPAGSGEEVDQCLHRLVEDTREHFANEEREMAERNFSAREDHHARHAVIMQELEQARQDYRISGDAFLLRVYVETVLKKRFIEHLTTYDFRFAEFSRRNR